MYHTIIQYIIMMALENKTGRDISESVRCTACIRSEIAAFEFGSPVVELNVKRTISASTITTALSMMMPKSTAPNEMRLAETPKEFIKMKAKSRDKGITVATTNAASQLDKKITSTAKTSKAPKIKLCTTVLTVSVTSSVRS